MFSLCSPRALLYLLNSVMVLGTRKILVDDRRGCGSIREEKKGRRAHQRHGIEGMVIV